MTPGHSSGETFLSGAFLYQIFKHPDQKKCMIYGTLTLRAVT